MSDSELRDRLSRHSQEHLLRWWPELTAQQRERLRAQLAAVDLDWLARQQAASGSGGESMASRARRAAPPAELARLPASDAERAAVQQAVATGEALLRAGRVGIILVAGGEATRLGYDYPKGMFPIGPVSGRTLFEVLADQAVARARRAGAAIPYYVMTSDATHESTVACFRERQFLGLPERDVHLFRQGNLPAIDRTTGRILLAAKDRLAVNPDGHGGLLAALSSAGLLEDMRRRGVDYLYYHQVDNPLARVCDPAFLGLHVERRSEVSTKVVSKLSAAEKMGVAVSLDGRTEIIEYSDLPAELANETDAGGALRFWAGSTAIHVFSRSFLDRLVREGVELPVHRAVKKVPCLDESGALVNPAEENAIKFERFIFDVLPLAERALVVEGARDEEFCPLKNKSGDFSPPFVQQALTRLHAGWLRRAGVAVPDGLPVEISPLYALDAEELAARVDRSLAVSRPIYLSKAGPERAAPGGA